MRQNSNSCLSFGGTGSLMGEETRDITSQKGITFNKFFGQREQRRGRKQATPLKLDNNKRFNANNSRKPLNSRGGRKLLWDQPATKAQPNKSRTIFSHS